MRIGILGGGQLGRMLALAGYPLGLNFIFYDPEPLCCASELAPLVQDKLDDQAQLLNFAKQVDLITYETENIPVEAIQYLSKHNLVYPSMIALQTCQDRLLEKQLFNKLNIPTNAYMPVNNYQELTNAAQKLGFPFLLKTRQQGYDGKGQYKINSYDDIKKIAETQMLDNYIAEEFIQFDREVSIISVVSKTGELCFYDICENTHQKGILIKTINKPNDDIFNLAKAYALSVIKDFNYVGTLAIEFFQKGDKLIANEIAPRVHNSGHWTIEGAVTSQFENHLRAIIGWPLGNTRSSAAIIMYNIISKMPNANSLMKFSDLHLHDYGKTERLGRKLGHVTLVNPAIEIEKGVTQLLSIQLKD